jgi:TetR/AcrR family transcriptional regulator, regulator of cefoperazone and chloramphenicol sensitivity
MATDHSRPRTQRRPDSSTGGYAKGDASRQRILDVALQVFGEVGFRTATTRRIADAAGIQLPAIQYYFGNKEGLYLACAHEIVARYRHYMGKAGAGAAKALKTRAEASVVRAALHDLIDALVELLVGSGEPSRWSAFITRERSDPGPAYEILYRDLWSPGVELTARLIACLCGEETTSPNARVQALLLISSVVGFQSGRSISLRLMDWPTVGQKEQQIIAAALKSQIDLMSRAQRLSA